MGFSPAIGKEGSPNIFFKNFFLGRRTHPFKKRPLPGPRPPFVPIPNLFTYPFEPLYPLLCQSPRARPAAAPIASSPYIPFFSAAPNSRQPDSSIPPNVFHHCTFPLARETTHGFPNFHHRSASILWGETTKPPQKGAFRWPVKGPKAAKRLPQWIIFCQTASPVSSLV